MRKSVFIIYFALVISSVAFHQISQPADYTNFYHQRLNDFESKLTLIKKDIESNFGEANHLIQHIHEARLSLKEIDFWLRYLEPISYKWINGPLPVEYETEVHEKFEKPYRREGAGLILLEQAINNHVAKDSCENLVSKALQGIQTFKADSILQKIKDPHHVLFCNRLLLLNLATIYTSGFDCPDTSQIIPELQQLIRSTQTIYLEWNKIYPNYFPENYLQLFLSLHQFVSNQTHYSSFNHFVFIRDYINPLFSLNQSMIRDKKARSSSLIDYSLRTTAQSIFSKDLYTAQSTKGLFGQVTDPTVLKEIRHYGRLFFNDPILSGNNQRSCASCHKPNQYFADTTLITHLNFNRTLPLKRNTPSLINVPFNHLLMQDGKHYTLLAQTKGVITNPEEMAGEETEIMTKVNAIKTYRSLLKKWTKLTPAYPEPSLAHISSAIIIYYASMSQYSAPFDAMMNKTLAPDSLVINGFNLFMGKAQCGTCHFAPIFNGVKPPYTNSEFEVLGVPADTAFLKKDSDIGRAMVFNAPPTQFAFRTGTIRNAAKTAPYMHNGLFNTLEQVIDFYDQGGGVGRGLDYPNQTLSAQKIGLTPGEKKALIAFIHSLTEAIPLDTTTVQLPVSQKKRNPSRTLGGVY